MNRIAVAGLALCLPLFASAEKIIDVTTDQIEAVRMHSTHSATAGVRNVATIKMSGLADGCDSGVFLEAEGNSATMSMILSAYVSKSNMRIAYEPNITSPWGSTKYCALTYFDIR